jgi:two-component system, cell cycle sensor histidine kinase and response regulator CckA
MGYEVILTENGTEALDFVRRAQVQGRAISALILDLTIPGSMGGEAVLKELRKIDNSTPVIAVSGYAAGPVMSDPVKYGFTASIAKPLRSTDLERVLGALT